MIDVDLNHKDVGGGEVSDKAPFALAYIPLRWMVRECISEKSGILFDPEALAEYGVVLDNEPNPSADGTTKTVKGKVAQYHVDQRERERRDALSPSHGAFDGFNTSWWPIWAPFELLPLPAGLMTENVSWIKVLR